MKISKVALVAHEGRARAADLRAELDKLLSERNVEIVSDAADLVISLGGDGTMLRAAQKSHLMDAPLLGINLGVLGYLAEVDADHARPALEKTLEGDFRIEERMMLSCTARSGGSESTFVGLNEVLVERRSRYHTVRLAVRVGGEALAAINADGVIVATPTGSTAYALSAGGPIVAPQADCMVLVPVCAHMVFSRPFVLSSDEVVEVEVVEQQNGASLSLDGAIGWDLKPGATATIRRHPRPLRLVKLSGPGFLQRLRTKLDLPV